MSLHPIRSAWYDRPAWSPFGAWRISGTHIGFDHYAKAGTPIYATGNGRVASSGWHEGGHGHFVRIAYPGNVIVSYSHMQAPTSVPWSGSVTAGTRMGTVGDTGNAAGIFWQHPSAGKLLHVHTEVRIGRKLVDPLTYFNSLDGALAGTDGTPITQPAEDTDMLIFTKNGDAVRVQGGGFKYQFKSPAELEAFQNALKTQGYPHSTTPQEVGSWSFNLFWDTVPTGSTTTVNSPDVTVSGGFTDADRKRLSEVPTATQNGQAARTAIVK